MDSGASYGALQGQGLIRVQSQSPYECLDPASSKWLGQLKQMWSLWKKSDAVTKILYDFFAKTQNPYVSVLQIMITCGDFYSGKPSSLSYNIMENFANWAEPRKPQILLCLTKDLKYDAFNLVIKQKNAALVKLVANVYQMAEDNHIFLNSIHDLVSSSMYKEACQYAAMLQLHDNFGIEEFIVPLVFQDKFAVAEEFLVGSPVHQVQIASYMDALLGKKNIKSEADLIITKLNIHEAKLDKLYYKPLSKLVARIVKTFQLPQSVCPNLMKKRGEGALQFLLHKRFVGKTIGDESWAEMAQEAVGNDQNLQLELVVGVTCYGDISEALHWAERFGLPFNSWPSRLQEYSGRNSYQGAHSVDKSPSETWDDLPTPPASKFHKLLLPENKIHLVDTVPKFSNFLKVISNGVYIVGIDSEWKPSIGIKKCDLALIQVATLENVYILDVLALVPITPGQLWEEFATKLFANPDVLKLGFGLSGDLSIMKDTLPCFQNLRLTGQGFMDLVSLWKVLIKNHNFVFPYSPLPDSSSTSESLNKLVELCFGEKLDKSDQFSNWERRPLRKSQISYAALDAYCLLEVYNVLRTEAESQNIPFIEILSEIMANQTTPKKSKRKKCEKTVPDMECQNGMNGKRISALDFRVLCDTMIAGLGKQLRKCGIDTIILEAGDEPCMKHLGEGPLCVVTRAMRCNRLRKYGHVYCVKSDSVKEQLAEVLKYFNVDISTSDIFSRCMECNSKEFVQVGQEDMKYMSERARARPYLPPPPEELYDCEANPDFDDFDCDGYSDEEPYGYNQALLRERALQRLEERRSTNAQSGNSAGAERQCAVDFTNCLTKYGTRIEVDAIPAGVFDQVPLFLICERCGKCYWEGSHRDRAMSGFIGTIVTR